MFVTEPPYFLQRPEDVVSVAGSDLILACQVGGDPTPVVRWKKQGRDSLPESVSVKPHQGLSILNLHPSDQGMYICSASNKAGSVTASAMLRVQEPPVISVKPVAHYQVQAGTTVRLDCVVAGSPSPNVFWTEETTRTVWYSGLTHSNVQMIRNNSLVLTNATVENTGHYLCSGVNSAGAAIERSQLLVYDVSDFNNTNSEHMDSYHITADIDITEARTALMGRTVEVQSVYPESSTSLRVTWKIVQPHKYIEGYFVSYKEARTRKNFVSVKVHHARATSYSITRLNVNTIYEVFIVPFYKSVMGMPSSSQKASTHEDIPSEGPVIQNVSIAGEDVSIFWLALEQKATNGLLEGYRLLISSNPSNSELANLVVSPSDNYYKVNLPNLGEGDVTSIVVEIAAINKAGMGPFSKPVQLDLGLLMLEGRVINLDSSLAAGADSTNVWVGALTGSLALFAICIGLVLLLRKRATQKEAGYLGQGSLPGQDQEKEDTLWIDRRWNNADCHDGSCTSDKKLLKHLERDQPENEYTYIDRSKLASFASEYAVSRHNEHIEQFHDLAPYASTDILRNQLARQRGSIYKVCTPYNILCIVALCNHHSCQHIICSMFQAMPLPTEPMKSAMQRTAFQNRHSRSSQSYDDLEDHYDALNNRHGYAKIRPRNRPSMDESVVSKSQDMWAYKMDDSIVSPKYLFDHPVYASHSQLDASLFQPKNLTTRSQGGLGSNKKKNKSHKIGPRTLNPKLVNPYSKVPIKHMDHYAADQSPQSHLLPTRIVLLPDTTSQQTTTLNTSVSSGSNSSPGESGYGLSHSSSGAEQMMLQEGVEEEELYSNDDYVDITSDSPDEDVQSIDENYKALTDKAMSQSTGSYNSSGSSRK